MSNSDQAKDKALYEGVVARMASANVPRDDAGMAASVAIEVIRQVELKIEADARARLGINKVAMLALATVAQLLPALAEGITEQMVAELAPKVGVEELIDGLSKMLQGDPEPIEDMLKNDMVNKAVQKGLLPYGKKQAIIILADNPTDQACNCSACMTSRLLETEPTILPEDRMVVDEELKVRAVRIDPGALRRIRRDAELMAQRAASTQ